MGIFTRDIHSMNDLFVHQLKDIYYAEKSIAAALPTMIEKSNNQELINGLEQHLDQTKNHVARLEMLRSSPRRKQSSITRLRATEPSLHGPTSLAGAIAPVSSK
jgi:ferritin-like metal-binding protein YciE